MGEEKIQRFINFAMKSLSEITLPAKRWVTDIAASNYRPHPKDGEGNVFSLCFSPHPREGTTARSQSQVGRGRGYPILPDRREVSLSFPMGGGGPHLTDGEVPQPGQDGVVGGTLSRSGWGYPPPPIRTEWEYPYLTPPPPIQDWMGLTPLLPPPRDGAA